MRSFSRSFSRSDSLQQTSNVSKLSDCFRRIRDAETALADARWTLTEYCESGGDHSGIRDKHRLQNALFAQGRTSSAAKRCSPCSDIREDIRHRTQPHTARSARSQAAFKRSASCEAQQPPRLRRAGSLALEGESQEPVNKGSSLLHRKLSSSSLGSEVGEFELLSPQSRASNKDYEKRPSDKSAVKVMPAHESRDRRESRDLFKNFFFDQVVISQSLLNLQADRGGPPMKPFKENTGWKNIMATSLTKGASTGSSASLARGETKLWQAKSELSWTSFWKFEIPVLNPASKRRLIWLLFGLVFILYEAMAVPFFLAFEIRPTGFWMVLAHIITVFFILDVFVTFFTGYVNRAGHLVFSLERIAWRYMRTWLVLDVIAAIPWEWFDPDYAEEKLTRSTKIVRFARMLHLFRLAKVLRLIKLKSVLDGMDLFFDSHETIVFAAGVFRVMAWLCAAMHWTACLWYAVGSQAGPKNWIDTFLSEGDLETPESYVWSMYFTMTTMTTVGYGDIHPTNYSECCFALILLPVSSVLFATLMGALTTLIGNINHRSRKIQEKKSMLTRYMNWRTVPTQLQVRIRQHLLFIWDMKEGYDVYEEALKSELPNVLKAELCYHLYGFTLNRAPFLEWMKDYRICMKNLASMVESIYLERGDVLFREGDANEQVYMLMSGVMWLSLNQKLHDGHEHGVVNPPSSERNGELAIPKKVDNGFLGEVGMVVSRMVHARKKAQDEPCGGSASCAPNIFDSSIMLKAGVKLNLQLSQEAKAALIVQRCWRKARARKKRPSYSRIFRINTPEQASVRKEPSKGPRERQPLSQAITAPAYFGESCLWVPYDKWDEVPLPYKYTTKCVERAEFIHIPRNAVEVVIRQFSPWLVARFKIFQEAVVEGLLNRQALEEDPDASNGMHAPIWPENTSLPTDNTVFRSRSSFSDDSPRTIKQEADAVCGFDAQDQNFADLPGVACGPESAS